MTEPLNQKAEWQSSPTVPSSSMQNSFGAQEMRHQSDISENMQLKTGQPVVNGPQPGTFSIGQRPPTNVNGVASHSASHGQSHMNMQFHGPRPPIRNGPPVMNGPGPGQPYQGSQPFQPGLPPPGQVRPGSGGQNFIGTRPPLSGPPPSTQSAFRRPQESGSQPASTPGPSATGPPPGMVGAVAPQTTFQGPPSQKSSRTNSPAVVNQNLDALEGQFRGTPEQETQAVGSAVWNQQGSSQPGIPPEFQPGRPQVQTVPQQPGMPPNSQPGPPYQGPQQPGMPPYSQPGPSYPGSQHTGMPPNSQQGPLNTGPQYGFPPSSQPGPPYTGQQQGFPPSSQPGPPFTGQQQGFPPSSQPGLPYGGTQPRFPPSNSQAGYPVANQGFQYSQTGQPLRPGFPPVPAGAQQPGLSTVSSPNQRPGFPPPPVSTSQRPGFPPASVGQRPGFPPPPMSSSQQPGFPPPVSANQQPRFPGPPASMSARPGFPPQPVAANQQPVLPPTSASQFQRFPPPPTTSNQPPIGQGQQSGQPYAPVGKTIGEFVNTYPKPNAGVNAMTASFNNMSVQGALSINLLQQKTLIPPDGIEIPKPVIPNDNRNVNCSPEVFRCTLNAIPQTSALLNKSRLPLGILIHPFKDLSQLPVIQSSVIVRCRSCRTYINPFVYFVDSRRWKCNLCYRVNELPDEFSFDPVTKTYGDPQRRPEIRSATIEFIAPSEYMLRPPQPAVYLYLIDVSFNAIETGYLTVFCETLLDVLDRIPGDSRTQIGFIAYDSAVHFFNLAEGLSQPQMLTVSDVEDIFLPSPDDLLVNLNESRSLVEDLLNQLPTLFENNMETRSALGAALQASFKMMSATGGRVTVLQTVLPTYGPGALQNREDATQKTTKDVSSLGPATDFYKKLALDCSAQQVAVDLFMFNGQYADLASIECISKFSGGCVSYYPSYHAVRTPHLTEKFEADLRRYLTRKIGFESVMRIRCSKGISIHTFHGNFFVRSTDLLSLPNVNPDAGFGMQMSIEESLTDMSTMCFQAALLYTSSKGERRIRVHTLCLPVSNQLSDIQASADQQAIIALLAKMAADRSISASLSDAREAIVNAAIDMLGAYSSSLPASQRAGGLCSNDQLKLIPLYCLALLKSTAFRTGISTRLDDRTYALHQCKSMPVYQLVQMLYPDLYPVHTIMDVEMTKKGSLEYPKLPLLQLSAANIDRNGAYLLDTGDTMYLYLGSAVNEQFCQDILDKPNFHAVQEGGISEFPQLKNEGSERLKAFVAYLLDSRPNGAALVIVREDGKLRMKFFQHFVEDRTESSVSYIEFLQQIQMQVKS